MLSEPLNATVAELQADIDFDRALIGLLLT
jgi:hypothetical protein